MTSIVEHGSSMVQSSGRAGRPEGSSRAMLEEAAAELFLEQGYAGTTIAQISRRAGVSRNTLFHYFAVKSDLLWVAVDRVLIGLPAALAEAEPGSVPTDAVHRALLGLANQFGSGDVPWALTDRDVMGTTAQLQASALARGTRQAALVSRFVQSRDATTAPLAAAFAWAVLAAAAQAAGVWARSGVQRGPLAPYIDDAISPVCAGFGRHWGYAGDHRQ
ncbi:MAG: TetR/AcrR family transcriptional regulator [Cryobacterium sp.]